MNQQDFVPSVVQAIDLAKGLSNLARIAKVKPPTVHEWKTGARPVPPRRCVLIEHGLGVPGFRRQLRPNDWREHWPELAEEGSHA